MQVEVPQILWHSDSRQIMSIDFYPNSNFLVTSSVISEEDTGIRVRSISDCDFWLAITKFPKHLTTLLLFVVLGANPRHLARRLSQVGPRISVRFAEWPHLNSKRGEILPEWLVPGDGLRRPDGGGVVPQAAPRWVRQAGGDRAVGAPPPTQRPRRRHHGHMLGEGLQLLCVVLGRWDCDSVERCLREVC